MSQYGDNPYYSTGGGFMASPGGSASGSPGGSGKKPAAHALRPVTIKQLLNATQAHTDADWQIDGVDISQVTVVALVVTVQPQTTNCIYWLDDCTGRMEARHWVDSSGGSDEAPIKEGSVIRLMGQIKQFGNKRYLNATHLRVMKDPHEFLFHPLEALTVKLMMERNPPGEPNAQATSTAARPSAASAYTAQTGQTASHDQFAHLPPMHRRILEFILNQPAHDDGVHVAAIARAIGGEATVISDALDQLMDDGQVYTTIDESHFNVSV